MPSSHAHSQRQNVAVHACHIQPSLSSQRSHKKQIRSIVKPHSYPDELFFLSIWGDRSPVSVFRFGHLLLHTVIFLQGSQLNWDSCMLCAYIPSSSSRAAAMLFVPLIYLLTTIQLDREPPPACFPQFIVLANNDVLSHSCPQKKPAQLGAIPIWSGRVLPDEPGKTRLPAFVAAAHELGKQQQVVCTNNNDLGMPRLRKYIVFVAGIRQGSHLSRMYNIHS